VLDSLTVDTEPRESLKLVENLEIPNLEVKKFDDFNNNNNDDQFNQDFELALQLSKRVKFKINKQ